MYHVRITLPKQIYIHPAAVHGDIPHLHRAAPVDPLRLAVSGGLHGVDLVVSQKAYQQRIEVLCPRSDHDLLRRHSQVLVLQKEMSDR